MATANPFSTQIETLTNSTQVKPITQAFDESKGVAGRVDAITNKNSSLMQRAAVRGASGAAARGLRNSSIAVGAAQNAVIDAATPIANADAGLFQQQALANQNALNQGNQFNASTKATIGVEGMKLGEGSRQFDSSIGLEKDKLTQNNSQFGQSLAEQARQYDSSAGLESQKLAQQQQQFTANAENQKVLAQMDADSRLALAGVEAKYGADIAGNENIGGAWGSMMQSIAQIQNNPELDVYAKTSMIQNTIQGFQSFTNFWKKVTGGTIDVSDLLNFNIQGATAGNGGGSPPPVDDGTGGNGNGN